MPLCCDADKGQIPGYNSISGSGIDSVFYIEQQFYNNVPFALRARNSRHAITKHGKVKKFTHSMLYAIL